MAYTLSAPDSVLGVQLFFHKRETAVEWRTGDRVDYIVAFEITETERSVWRHRENTRLSNGEYLPLPWMTSGDYDRDHTLKARITSTERELALFSHLSLKYPGQIAFTLSEEHGYNDRQTTMRPGKYLQKYFPDMLTIAERDKFIANVTTKTTLPKVTIARTAADIRTVYNSIPSDGLTSCMQRKTSQTYDWQGSLDRGSMPCHPTEVYGNSDLGVAYLGPIGDIIARCVVWPDKKLFSRTYGLHGHDNELSAVLESLGYCKGSMSGALINLIRDNDDRIVMPYIDGIDNASVIGNRVRLGSGDLGTEATDGYATIAEDTVTCPECGHETDQDELDDHGGYCRSCDENYTNCSSCEDRIACDDSYNTDNGSYCRSCYQDVTTLCAMPRCHNRWIESELDRSTRRDRADHGVTALCESCGEDREYCGQCGEYYDRSEDDCPDCRVVEDDTDTDTDTTPEVPETSPVVTTDPQVCDCSSCVAMRSRS